MTRTFGIELEVVGKRGQQVGLWARITTALTAAGIDHATAGYTGSDYSRWQVKSDSSVSCNGYPGAEVVSPVMPATDAGFAEVARVARTVEAAGATANKTCGMHVHVDVRDLSVDQIKNVLRAYGHFQEQINQVLPPSRRQSRWAAPVWNNYNRETMLRRIEAANTVMELAYAIGTRYTVCNLQKYTRTGTLEFRQHSGTADAQKAENWARWCVAFVEAFKDINVLHQPVEAAEAQITVIRHLEGRGQRRNPSRGISRALVAQLATATSEADLQSLIYSHGGTYTVLQWMEQLASRYGISVQRVTMDGGNGWRLAREVEVTARGAFEACFTPGGRLAYFGARRAALA